ncbi:MAG TPA: tetratricopeptide repeat protein [Kofleriaceae bacterium]|nr:tetratricopeptide repeat protein [Kofleriaceae bacterium]
MLAQGISRSRSRPGAWAARATVTFAALIAASMPGPAAADRAVARALVEEGTRLSSAGRSERALERMVRAIDEDPDYLPAYEAAVGLWLRAGEFEPVIRHLARVTLRHPRYGFGWYTLGFAYRRTGRHELAVLCYREYLELRPDEADPYFGLAMSLVELDRKEEAATALERYLVVERRPEQREFVARAKRELSRLRAGPAPATPGAATWQLVRRALGRIDAAARAAGRAFAPR